MDYDETYALRYNKKKNLIELLFELMIYEKKKEGSKIDFENDKYYKYIENIVKLLFNYIFNLNKEKANYIITEYTYNKDDYSSSSDNLSENFINSTDDEISKFFNFNNNNVKGGMDKFCSADEDLDKFEDTDKSKNENNIKVSDKKENVETNANNIHMENITNNIGNNKIFEKKTKQKIEFCKKNNMSNFFFNFDLNCNKSTQTIREKKKIEEQILSIYYTSFSSNVIDILLNNSQIEISDIILFFIFDDVGNIHDISSFFSKGFYTFNNIYSYIEEFKSNKPINKNKEKHNDKDNFISFKDCHNKNKYLDENKYFKGSDIIKEEGVIEDYKEEICTNNRDEFKSKGYSCIKKTKNEEPFLSISDNKRNKEDYIDDLCQRNNDIIYIYEMLKQKNSKENNIFYNENICIPQLKNIIINDDVLIIQNFKFKLNKSSVLLNKFIGIINLQLEKQKHFRLCLDIFFLKNLKLNFLEASKPWIFYWCIHTIYILYDDFEIEQKLGKNTFNYIKKCVFLYLNKIKTEKDCFGGGLNQYTHIATTYATVCVFIYLHDNENNFLSFLDKKKIHSYILKLKCADGSFRLHKNGEIDMRGTYCAISICSMCHILTNKVKKNVEKYILSCQNYEGGFTSEKFQECHGGYTYCALATLCILGKTKKINLNNLMNWLINKQSNLEGSFMGRTNKLVDSCYSFWMGSIFFLINEIYILKQIFQQNKLKKKCMHKKYKSFEYDSLDELNNFKNNDIEIKNIKYVKNENFIINTNENGTIDSNYNKINIDCYSCNNNTSNTYKNERSKCSESMDAEINQNIYDHINPYNAQTHKEILFFENYNKMNKEFEEKILFNMNHMKLYLLLCSQSSKGGMKDKPKEKVDYYHTCYALSGLSLIENYISSNIHNLCNVYDIDNMSKLNKIHILYNITVQKVYKSYNYFSPNFSLNENKINHKIGKGAYLYLKRLVC